MKAFSILATLFLISATPTTNAKAAALQNQSELNCTLYVAPSSDGVNDPATTLPIKVKLIDGSAKKTVNYKQIQAQLIVVAQPGTAIIYLFLTPDQLKNPNYKIATTQNVSIDNLSETAGANPAVIARAELTYPTPNNGMVSFTCSVITAK